MSQPGIVAIGRNEGQRLRRCLASAVRPSCTVVYVDSGSSDGSSELARSIGAEVVELDPSIPFTAARARNAGFERLQQVAPGLGLVQFVDGDCELVAGWLDTAKAALDERPDVAVVAGRCRELHPQQTIYSRLADLEWDTPIGEAKACGGNAMIRASVFRRVSGFDPSIIAGEEHDLCVRIRAEGWKLLCIDADMVVHDIEMTRFAQWWRRAVRSGHAYAEVSARHAGSPERHFTRQTCSAIFWGFVLPATALGLAWPTWGVSLALLAGYLILFWRAGHFYRSYRGWPALDAWLWAASCVLAKFPHIIGVGKYWSRRISRRPSRIIEYKGG